MTVAKRLPGWPHFSHSPRHKSPPNFKQHKYPQSYQQLPTCWADLSLLKQHFPNQMELNIVFQYVTLLDSHFNIELFKPQRKHNKSLWLFHNQNISTDNFRGDTMEISPSENEKIRIDLVRSKIWYQLEWSQKLSIVTHLGRDWYHQIL